MSRSEGQGSGSLLEARHWLAELEGCNTTPMVKWAREIVAELAAEVETVVQQHSRVWAAVTKDGGMRLLRREGWRDANFHEWDVWVGPMVECPRCAFTFGADHTDEGHGEGYSCPNCDYDGHVSEESTLRGCC